MVQIRPGIYTIGNDRITDAKPRHRRRIDRPFWIDCEPVPPDLFAAFVHAGGYTQAKWWPGERLRRPVSVDARCERVGRLIRPVSDAASGLSWFEASAVAAFSGARLPFESEWEIAATESGDAVRVTPGVLEWTADVFSPVYWRADFAGRGRTVIDFQPGQTVSVRGFSPGDLVQHLCVRRGVGPDADSAACGLRRVWDVPPAGAEIVTGV